jgi:hypothetical protein
MTYYADLTEYSYTRSSEGMLNVGWLGRGERFTTGPVDADVRDQLIRLAVEPANVMRGLHDCEFCDKECPIRMPTEHSPRGYISLGTGEIRVSGEDGRVYVSPTLLLHYIDEHGYRPPEQFILAVRDAGRRRRTQGVP